MCCEATAWAPLRQCCYCCCHLVLGGVPKALGDKLYKEITETLINTATPPAGAVDSMTSEFPTQLMCFSLIRLNTTAMLMTNVEHNVGLIYLCIGHMHQVELYLDDLLAKSC